MIEIVGKSFWLPWEPAFMIWLQKILGEVGGRIAAFFTLFGEELVIVALLGFLYWAYDKKYGEAVACTVVTGLMWNQFFKSIFVRRRPYFDHEEIRCLKAPSSGADPMDVTAQGYSFPSGHSTNAAAVYPALYAHKRKKWLLAVGITMPLLVGLSRVCLGVHYPTDVLVGWGFGLLSVIWVAWMQKHARPWVLYAIMGAVGIAGCFFARTSGYYSTLGMMFGFFGALSFEKRFVRFENTRFVPRMILRTLVGCGLFAGILNLLKLPFDTAFLAQVSFPAFLVRVLRYGISTFLAMGVYPLCFRYFDPLWNKWQAKCRRTADATEPAADSAAGTDPQAAAGDEK